MPNRKVIRTLIIKFNYLFSLILKYKLIKEILFNIISKLCLIFQLKLKFLLRHNRTTFSAVIMNDWTHRNFSVSAPKSSTPSPNINNTSPMKIMIPAAHSFFPTKIPIDSYQINLLKNPIKWCFQKVILFSKVKTTNRGIVFPLE